MHPVSTSIKIYSMEKKVFRGIGVREIKNLSKSVRGYSPQKLSQIKGAYYRLKAGERLNGIQEVSGSVPLSPPRKTNLVIYMITGFFCYS